MKHMTHMKEISWKHFVIYLKQKFEMKTIILFTDIKRMKK